MITNVKGVLAGAIAEREPKRALRSQQLAELYRPAYELTQLMIHG